MLELLIRSKNEISLLLNITKSHDEVLQFLLFNGQSPDLSPGVRAQKANVLTTCIIGDPTRNNYNNI